MRKIKDRVNTTDGIGTIVGIEEHSTWNFVRYGVLHDVFPKDKPRMYKDDVLFYFDREVTDI